MQKKRQLRYCAKEEAAEVRKRKRASRVTNEERRNKEGVSGREVNKKS